MHVLLARGAVDLCRLASHRVPPVHCLCIPSWLVMPYAGQPISPISFPISPPFLSDPNFQDASTLQNIQIKSKIDLKNLESRETKPRKGIGQNYRTGRSLIKKCYPRAWLSHRPKKCGLPSGRSAVRSRRQLTHMQCTNSSSKAYYLLTKRNF